MKKTNLFKICSIALLSLAITGCKKDSEVIENPTESNISEPINTTSDDVEAKKLDEAKKKGKDEVSSYKDLSLYRENEKKVLQDLIDKALADIDKATTVEKIDEIVKAFKTEADKVKTDAELTEDERIKEVNITGDVTNAFDGSLSGVTIRIGESETTSDENGHYSFADIKVEEKEMTLTKAGYDTKRVALDLVTPNQKDITVDVELVKAFANYGKLVSKSWQNYERFTLNASRSSTDLILEAISDNTVFTSEGRNARLETYISVGEISGRDINVYRVNISSNGAVDKYNYGDKDLSSYDVRSTIDIEGEKTRIRIEVPFSMLGVTNDAIVGLCAGLWSENDTDWAPMGEFETEIVHAVESPSSYLRIDKENFVFNNSKNEYYVAPSYDKAELIADHPLHTADPDRCAVGSRADDIYIKSEVKDGRVDLDILGFGDMADAEHLKLIFHTGSNHAGGWGIQSSDVTVMLNKTSAKKAAGMTSFWDYVDFGRSDETDCQNQPTTVEHDGYFNISWSLDFSELASYSTVEQLSLFAMEFDAGLIYDAGDFGMMNNGNSMGDPANQANYFILQEKAKRMDTTGFPIEFSKTGHDIFAKVDREDEGMKLTLISESNWGDNDYIRFIAHSGSDATGGWSLNATDVSFYITKTSSFLKTGVTSFWDGDGQLYFGASAPTLNEPEFVQNELYWQLSFIIDYSEISSTFTKESPCKGMIWEFTNANNNTGAIQNTPNSSHFYNGNPISDSAVQSSYFDI